MTVRIIQGDVREELPKLPADSFDCIVTSPPYFGLRDYGYEGQIGLEATLDEYLETMVAVCRDLRRVLKPSGVFFLNIGDSYNNRTKIRTTSHQPSLNNFVDDNWADRAAKNKRSVRMSDAGDGIKEKDLCLVPERLGIALQADGWWVRSHIIWAKPNPMPESVTDRPTSAHETIWMLTKSARYFWDSEAVREAINPNNNGECSVVERSGGTKFDGIGKPVGAIRKYEVIKGANLRNVWPVASHPFPGAHFATMPPEIAELCIKAGSSERGCCPACGAPWVRVIERNVEWGKRTGSNLNKDRCDGGMSCNAMRDNKTLGWQPSCRCTGIDFINASIPCRILDPFAGSGTTGLVVDRLGRDATLIDLNTSYIDMAVNRIRDDAPLFAEVAAE